MENFSDVFEQFNGLPNETDTLVAIDELIELYNLTVQSYAQCQKQFHQISTQATKTKDPALNSLITCLKEDARSKAQQYDELASNLSQEVLLPLIQMQIQHKEEISQISQADLQAFQKKALAKLTQCEDDMVTYSHAYWKAKKDFVQADLQYKNSIVDASVTPQLKQQLFQNMTQKLKYSKQNEKLYRDFVDKANEQRTQLLDELKVQFDKMIIRDQKRLDQAVEGAKKYILYEQFHDASKKFNLGILQTEINNTDVKEAMDRKFSKEILEWNPQKICKFMFVENEGVLDLKKVASSGDTVRQQSQKQSEVTALEEELKEDEEEEEAQ